MAFGLANDTEQPQHTTVARYTVSRLNEVPSITLSYAETVDVTETPVRLESVTETGTVEVPTSALYIPAWQTRTDLVGRTVLRASDKTVVGIVTGVIEAVVDGEGVTTSPRKFQMDRVVAETLATKGVTVTFVNAVGSVAHRQAGAGRSWDVTVPMTGPGATRANAMLIGASVKLVKQALVQLGDNTTTLAQVQSAVMAMAMQGTNLDTILAMEAEALELDRQAGLVPYAGVIGHAPKVAVV